MLAYFARRRELAERTFRIHPGEILAGEGDHVGVLEFDAVWSAAAAEAGGRVLMLTEGSTARRGAIPTIKGELGGVAASVEAGGPVRSGGVGPAGPS